MKEVRIEEIDAGYIIAAIDRGKIFVEKLEDALIIAGNYLRKDETMSKDEAEMQS